MPKREVDSDIGAIRIVQDDAGMALYLKLSDMSMRTWYASK